MVLGIYDSIKFTNAKGSQLDIILIVIRKLKNHGGGTHQNH